MLRKAVCVLFTALIVTAALPAGAQDRPAATTTASLNLRTGPGADHPVIDALPYGTPVFIEGRDWAREWVLVNTEDGARGWLSAYYLAFDEGVQLEPVPVSDEIIGSAAPAAEASDAPAAEGTFITTVALNLRYGTGEQYDRVAVLPVSTRVVVEVYAGDWARVHTEDGALQGWLVARFLMDANAPVPPPIIAVSDRMREIYQRGLAMGNNPRAVSRLGDCNSLNPFFLAPFDAGTYNLGEYVYLQAVIGHFAGSFSREGVGVHGSTTAAMIFDPTWADPDYCFPDETPIACEFRLNRPSVVFVSFGTHDDPLTFSDDLRAIADFAIANGVVSVFITKADIVNNNNTIMAAVAAEYQIPLLDFGAVAAELPHLGTREDGARLSYSFPLDFSDPDAMQTGHTVRNLMALQVLDAIWRGVMQ
jgi:uncharacterized protein YraI